MVVGLLCIGRRRRRFDVVGVVGELRGRLFRAGRVVVLRVVTRRFWGLVGIYGWLDCEKNDVNLEPLVASLLVGI